MKTIIVILVLSTLVACGGGGSSAPEERYLRAYEACHVKLMDNKCPIDEIYESTPNPTELLK